MNASLVRSTNETLVATDARNAKRYLDTQTRVAGGSTLTIPFACYDRRKLGLAQGG
jgi:hypothetical protein